MPGEPEIQINEGIIVEKERKWIKKGSTDIVRDAIECIHAIFQQARENHEIRTNLSQITRVITPEYSFYPPEKNLFSMKDYKFIIRGC